MDELKSLAGGLDALYLTPSGPHQMALFTGDEALRTVPVSEPPAALDAFYVTRLQKERMSGKEAGAGEYVRFDARALRTSRTQEAVVMHPLPRTSELAYELDADPRAVYFEQAAAGVPVRMALIAWLMEKASRASASPSPVVEPIRFKAELPPRCANPNCITRFEGAYLPPRFTLGRSADTVLALKCDFCERDLKIEYVGHARSHRYYRFDETLQGYVRQWIEEGSLAVFDSVKQAEEGGYEPYKRGPQREIMNEGEVVSAIESLADQVIADVPDMSAVSIVGVVSRGAMLALRLRDLIGSKTRVFPPTAALDVYKPADALRPLDGTEIFNVEDRTIILVDDVINSGWTVQRAMATIWHRGRPAAVKLAVLIDRGHRAVPIRPNYVGKNIPTSRTERVQVRLAAASADPKTKSHDRVMIYSIVEPMKESGAVP
jgi:pyrimidine operon attenuation protein / uracil phosphoribosyltransferase